MTEVLGSNVPQTEDVWEACFAGGALPGPETVAGLHVFERSGRGKAIAEEDKAGRSTDHECDRRGGAVSTMAQRSRGQFLHDVTGGTLL